jgi:hypothetical protein
MPITPATIKMAASKILGPIDVRLPRLDADFQRGTPHFGRIDTPVARRVVAQCLRRIVRHVNHTSTGRVS